MDIETGLKNLGLKKSEIAVYLYLLRAGASTPPMIAKGTGIARTNCYRVLTALHEKELIQTQPLRKRRAYFVRDPESLVSGLERKTEFARQIVPELRDFYTTQKNKPKIRFFSGWEEVKEVFRLTLEAKKLFALGSTETLAKIDRKFMEWHWNEMQKRKIIFDDILTADAKGKTAEEIKSIRGALQTVRFLPEQFGDQPMDIFIWDDNIAFMALSEPIFATLITDAPLVKAIKIMHRALWEKL